MGLANFPPAQNSFGAPMNNNVGGGRGRLKYSDDGGGAAGVYTVSVAQPAGSILLDVILHAIALWNAGTSATGIVGDTTDPNGFFAAIDMKATDLLAGEAISVALAGGKAGADIALSQFNRRYSAAGRDITLEITTVGTAATTGETLLDVFWLWPSRVETTGAFTAS